MKKLTVLLVIMSLVVMPFGGYLDTYAETSVNVTPDNYSAELKVGDRVSVRIVDDSYNNAFYVIKPSAPGATYVWLMYMGEVEGSPTVYDETIPGTHYAQGEGPNEHIYKIIANLKNTWQRAKTVRIPNQQDFTDLGITDGKIMLNKAFIAPNPAGQTDPSRYNYWTDICDGTCVASGPTDIVKMKYVKLAENHNGDAALPVATLESISISDPATSPRFMVKPVIEIDKKYIDCLPFITTTTIVSPPTGEVIFPVELFAIIVIAGGTYYLLRKKAVFDRI